GTVRIWFALTAERTKCELCLQDAGGMLAQLIPQIGSGAQQVTKQLHLCGRAGKLMPKFQHWRERRTRSEGPIETSAQCQHVAARHSDSAGDVEIAGAQSPHLPSIQRHIRRAERHADGRVREHPITDCALPSTTDVVVAGRGIDQRAPEVLSTAEWPFETRAQAYFTTRRECAAARHGRVARSIPIARAGAHSPVRAHL